MMLLIAAPEQVKSFCKWDDPIFGNSYDLTYLRRPKEYLNFYLTLMV